MNADGPGTAALWTELQRQAERMEVATRLLHNRRHRLGLGSTCGRCRDDVEAVAKVLLAD